MPLLGNHVGKHFEWKGSEASPNRTLNHTTLRTLYSYLVPSEWSAFKTMPSVDWMTDNPYSRNQRKTINVLVIILYVFQNKASLY